MVPLFGAALFTVADATALLGQLTSAITDNLPAVLVIVGGIAGISWARRFLNRGLKGKV